MTLRSRKLHVFQNATGSTVIARDFEEAIALVKKHFADKGKKPISMQYKQVPDKDELVVFETYAQRFIPLKAEAWAKRLGKGIPNAEEN